MNKIPIIIVVEVQIFRAALIRVCLFFYVTWNKLQMTSRKKHALKVALRN